MGMADDTKVRHTWDRLYKEGKVTVERPVAPRKEEPQPTAKPKPGTWNGKSNDKRRRELQSVRREADFAGLYNVAKLINRLCTALEDVRFEEYELEGVTEEALWEISAIHDDLISLGEWHDRALSSVQHWLDDEGRAREDREAQEHGQGRTGARGEDRARAG